MSAWHHYQDKSWIKVMEEIDIYKNIAVKYTREETTLIKK